jgi:hypothetical protein
MTFKFGTDPAIEYRSIDVTSPRSGPEPTSSDPNSKEHNMAQASLPFASQPPVPPPPPVTQLAAAAPDPFDPSQFAANSTIIGDAGVVKQLVVCPVRKPNKQEFVRVHTDPEYHLAVHILELKTEQETYLVTPEVAAALPGETRQVTLMLAVNRQGSAFLWPVPAPNLTGRENHWHTSARAGATYGFTSWVKLVPNTGSYDVLAAPGALGNPVWPKNSMRDLLAIAFGETFTIRDLSHSVIKRLLGQS